MNISEQNLSNFVHRTAALIVYSAPGAKVTGNVAGTPPHVRLARLRADCPGLTPVSVMLLIVNEATVPVLVIHP